MFLRVLRDISKPQWVEILLQLKRTQGLAVGDLAKRMKMSYMGVKEHCVELERLGYLDTWRQPQKVGRPKKLYRLTEKAAELFPTIGNELGMELLNLVKQTYGASVPERLLLGFFTQKADSYRARIKGDTVAARATAFARIRSLEGYLSETQGLGGHDEHEENEDGGERKGPRLVEYHSLIHELEQAYPTVVRMEEQMIGSVLGVKVEREVKRTSGLSEYTFRWR